MSLLDRLRGQPGWQHEDPLVRASAVDDLENDAQDVFAAVASEDADAGVRLAAVVRLSDPATIGRIARTDSDGQVRDEAISMLRAIAVEATEAAAGEAALAGLSEERDLGEVARTAHSEAVSRSALGRLDSQKAIGAVARRSVHRAVRGEALDRLDDRDELAAVVIKTDHREIALAAFERLGPLGPADRDLLRTVAVRARTKAVSRRAKTAFAEVEARPAPLTAGERRRRREELCERVEGLVGDERWDAVSAALDQAERDWRELEEPEEEAPGGDEASAEPAGSVAAEADAASEGPDAAEEPVSAEERTAVAADADTAVEASVEAPAAADATVAERWRAAVAAGVDHLARLDAARGAADRRRQIRSDALAARVALCDRLTAMAADETRDADALVAEIGVVRAEWAALPEVPPVGDDSAGDERTAVGDPAGGDASTQVERRFADLVAAVERQAGRRRTAADRVARLAALAEKLEAVSATQELEELTTGWKAPHDEWTALAADSSSGELAELSPRVAAAEQKRGDRLFAAREARRRREQANLVKQKARCGEIERALADDGLELKDAEHFLRLTRSLLGNLGRLPNRQDREALTNRLRAAQTGLTGRVRELRALVEWKRWANVGVQAALCQRLEALAARGEKDDEKFAREFREIMNEWRQASDVVRDEGNDVWQRFKAAHDALHPRFEIWRTAQDAVRRENLAKKVALCEEAERLAESTEWIKVAQRMTELQEQWKQVGSATRKEEREVWNRFRAACGHFFRRRRQDLAERKEVWAKNAQLKEQLCGKAEALADESDLEAAKAAVRQLQAEWKTVGPVRRSRSETLWQRFRAACDQVYARSREAVDAPYVELIRARAALCDRLEALATDGGGEEGAAAGPPADGGGEEGAAAGPPADLAAAVEAVRAEWRTMEPIPRPQERSLSARFDAALGRVVDRFPGAFAGTDLDPLRHVPALERLCERVESMVRAETSAPSADERSPSEILASRLREALASNTMGARADADARRREDAETVRRLQAERRALGVIPGETGHQLSDRFRAACDRYFQLNPAPPPPPGTSKPRGGGSRRGEGARGGRRRRD